MKIVLWIVLILIALLVIDAKTPAFAWLSKLIARPDFNLINSFPPIEYGPDRLVPKMDDDGNYYYETDRALRVMQLTDVHFGCGLFTRKADKKAMNAIYAMLAAEKPDLCIFTGDQIYPVIFQSGTFNNLLETRFFIAFMEHLGCYYTVTMGNHESEIYSPGSRKKIAELYDSPENHFCIFKTGEDIAAGISKGRTGFDKLPPSVQKTAISTEIKDFGYGNQVIKVKNSVGLITQAIFTMDTHSYTHGDYFGILYLYDRIGMYWPHCRKSPEDQVPTRCRKLQAGKVRAPACPLPASSCICPSGSTRPPSMKSVRIMKSPRRMRVWSSAP